MKRVMGVFVLCASLLTAPWLNAGIQPAHNVSLMEQSVVAPTEQAPEETPTAKATGDDAVACKPKESRWVTFLCALGLIVLTFGVFLIPKTDKPLMF